MLLGLLLAWTIQLIGTYPVIDTFWNLFSLQNNFKIVDNFVYFILYCISFYDYEWRLTDR